MGSRGGMICSSVCVFFFFFSLKGHILPREERLKISIIMCFFFFFYREFKAVALPGSKAVHI